MWLAPTKTFTYAWNKTSTKLIIIACIYKTDKATAWSKEATLYSKRTIEHPNMEH